MNIALNATSQSLIVSIVDDDGVVVTGLVAATMPDIYYAKAGANAAVQITLSDLATIATAWASGGVKEIGRGDYRLDVPNAAFTTATRVKLSGEATDKHLIHPVIDVGTDIPALIDALPTAADNAAALMDLSNGIETSITPRQAIRLILAAVAGKLSGAATTQITIRNVGDSKDRITATVDSSGNRTAVTVDGT